MKKWLWLLLALCMLAPLRANGEMEAVYQIVTEQGEYLTHICAEAEVGDEYISADNRLYEIVRIDGDTAVAADRRAVELPALDWLDADAVVPVTAMSGRIALYCTHSDECYEPSDGFYSTTETGTIYQVAHALADSLTERGVDATVADTLHHPHDAGAYRRSRQTAVKLLKESVPDCLIDIHRDGIPDPESYAVTIGGREASKIRLLVGRGNQNAALNKDFALTVKAVADRIYPGLIKDIYMGKGAFNQDLLPRSILLECGTYTLEKERVLASMPMMADVLDRALYGGVTGSAGRLTSDVGSGTTAQGGITMGEPDATVTADDEGGTRYGLIFIGAILVIGLVLFGILSTGSFRGGMRKAGRSLSEMTGGLIGKKPRAGEDPEHS